MNVPKSDDELRKLLKDKCGRSDEQIDAMFDFRDLSNTLKNGSENELENRIKNLKKKYD